MSIIENVMELLKTLQNEPGADLYYCAINGSLYPLSNIEKMGYNEFATRTKVSIPDKLYKFFPNNWTFEPDAKKPVNYGHQALINNTVFMQSPEQFDDIYDSDMNIEWKEYSNIKLRDYCQRCACDVNDSSTYEEMLYKIATVFYNNHIEKKSFYEAFVNAELDEREQKRNELFSLYIEKALHQEIKREANSGQEIQNAVHSALLEEYSNFTKRLRRTFRTSCFTTNPYSQLMWGGAYADSHKGFCVEYNVDKENEEHTTILHNLFPVIYCKSRPNMTERLANIWDGEFTTEKMWDIYFHGSLRKSFEWVQQNEWRLLLPMSDNSQNYNMSFFPISKVYIGNRMAKKDKADIIEICKQKNIPYIGVRRSADVFEMKDCDILCENCPNFLA